MVYKIVQKDKDDGVGFLHKTEYKTLASAVLYIKTLRRTLSRDYYDVFVVEVEE